MAHGVHMISIGEAVAEEERASADGVTISLALRGRVWDAQWREADARRRGEGAE
jgi:hypothetical protein